MKIKYTTHNQRMTIEFEAGSHKAIWKQLASFEEVFEETTCQKCKSGNVRHILRKARKNDKEYEYYELRCADCGAKLAFGILDDGSDNLFPKRRNEEGGVKGEKGWVKWNPATKQEE